MEVWFRCIKPFGSGSCEKYIVASFVVSTQWRDYETNIKNYSDDIIAKIKESDEIAANIRETMNTIPHSAV
jgi:hypothetical protein